jgi:putative peptidoglycan lipid II flippase
MVQRILDFLNKEISGIHQAAYLLGFFAICSQILALVRDKLLAYTFGAAAGLDMYYAAFRIPDFLFVTVGSLVSMSVLVPFLIENLEKGKAEGRKFVNSVFTFFLLAISVSGLVLWVLMPVLVENLFPGFTEEAWTTVTTLSRFMLLSPVFLGISNLFGSLTQSHNRFFIYALSPLFYNLGIIVGIVVLYPLFGLMGLIGGVVLGAILHLLIQVPSAIRIGILPRLTWHPDWQLVKSLARLSLPRTLTLSAGQISTIFLISFASLIAAGSISVFNLSFNIHSVPLSIIGVSYSLAAFPTLSRFFTEGKRSEFLEQMITSARHIIFWSIPFTVLFIVLRAHLVRLVLGAGAFNWTDTRLTAALLALFSISLVFQGLSLLLVRGFYASNKTTVPFFISLFSGAVIVFSAYVFLRCFVLFDTFRFFLEELFRIGDIPGSPVLALALGFSFGSMINGVLLWFFFERLAPGFSRGVKKVLFDAFSASVIMGFITYLALQAFSPFFDLDRVVGLLGHSTIAFAFGLISGILTLILLDNREMGEIWSTVHGKFWKVKTLSPDAEVTNL